MHKNLQDLGQQNAPTPFDTAWSIHKKIRAQQVTIILKQVSCNNAQPLVIVKEHICLFHPYISDAFKTYQNPIFDDLSPLLRLCPSDSHHWSFAQRATAIPKAQLQVLRWRAQGLPQIPEAEIRGIEAHIYRIGNQKHVEQKLRILLHNESYQIQNPKNR